MCANFGTASEGLGNYSLAGSGRGTSKQARHRIPSVVKDDEKPIVVQSASGYPKRRRVVLDYRLHPESRAELIDAERSNGFVTNNSYLSSYSDS
jgi:hypothetical protein